MSLYPAGLQSLSAMLSGVALTLTPLSFGLTIPIYIFASQTIRLCLFTVHAGSPFFEVALYRDRWFLRDGYHRAYALLKAGIFKLPAVIVQARTRAELGAVQPWFFSEETLLFVLSTARHLADFLNDALTLDYDRPSSPSRQSAS